MRERGEKDEVVERVGGQREKEREMEGICRFKEV